MDPVLVAVLELKGEVGALNGNISDFRQSLDRMAAILDRHVDDDNRRLGELERRKAYDDGAAEVKRGLRERVRHYGGPILGGISGAIAGPAAAFGLPTLIHLFTGKTSP